MAPTTGKNASLGPGAKTRHGQRAGLAYDDLRQMIVSGALAPGERVLEEECAARLGISRTPVREAIGRLVTEGLLVKPDGGPHAVHRISADEILEILNVRRLLEVEAARRAAGSPGRDDLLTLRRVFVGFLEGNKPDADAHMAADDALHERLATMARSAILAELVVNLRLRTRVFDKGIIPDRFEPGCHEHIAIIDAVLSGEPQRAEDAMRLHLKGVADSILAHLKTHP
ncbi:MAG: GntR family transcriptional regulator [Devosia sp.]